MCKKEILNKISDIIFQYVPDDVLQEYKILEKDTLDEIFNKYGIDDIDFQNIIIDLEQDFKITLENDVINDINDYTISKIVSYIMSKINLNENDEMVDYEISDNLCDIAKILINNNIPFHFGDDCKIHFKCKKTENPEFDEIKF